MIATLLRKLPEPYASEALALAIANKRSVKIVYYSDMVDIRHAICDALMSAFIWDKSPQGREYWNEVYTEIQNNGVK